MLPRYLLPALRPLAARRLSCLVLVEVCALLILRIQNHTISLNSCHRKLGFFKCHFKSRELGSSKVDVDQ